MILLSLFGNIKPGGVHPDRIELGQFRVLPGGTIQYYWSGPVFPQKSHPHSDIVEKSEQIPANSWLLAYNIFIIARWLRTYNIYILLVVIKSCISPLLVEGSCFLPPADPAPRLHVLDKSLHWTQRPNCYNPLMKLVSNKSTPKLLWSSNCN